MIILIIALIKILQYSINEFALLKGRRFELTGGEFGGIGEVTELSEGAPEETRAEIAENRDAWRKLADAGSEGSST